MNKYKLILALLILFLGCKSYEPFSSRKEKKQRIQLIKKNMNFSSAEIQKIDGEDSLIFYFSEAVKVKKIKPFVDKEFEKFKSNNSTRKELMILLELKTKFPNTDFMLMPKDVDASRYPSYKSVKKFITSIDTMKTIYVERSVDSLKPMKEKQKRKNNK